MLYIKSTLHKIDKNNNTSVDLKHITKQTSRTLSAVSQIRLRSELPLAVSNTQTWQGGRQTRLREKFQHNITGHMTGEGVGWGWWGGWWYQDGGERECCGNTNNTKQLDLAVNQVEFLNHAYWIRTTLSMTGYRLLLSRVLPMFRLERFCAAYCWSFTVH